MGLIKISEEVSEALSNGHAVVALESTIISHGNSLSLSISYINTYCPYHNLFNLDI